MCKYFNKLYNSILFKHNKFTKFDLFLIASGSNQEYISFVEPCANSSKSPQLRLFCIWIQQKQNYARFWGPRTKFFTHATNTGFHETWNRRIQLCLIRSLTIQNVSNVWFWPQTLTNFPHTSEQNVYVRSTTCRVQSQNSLIPPRILHSVLCGQVGPGKSPRCPAPRVVMGCKFMCVKSLPLCAKGILPLGDLAWSEHLPTGLSDHRPVVDAKPAKEWRSELFSATPASWPAQLDDRRNNSPHIRRI